MKIKIAAYNKGESMKNCLEMLEKTFQNAGHEVIVDEITPRLKLKEYEYFKLNKIELQNTDYSVKPYDLIIIGTPVWSFQPNPVVTEYIKRLKDCDSKNFAIFIICILPANVIKKLSSLLASKGANVVSTYIFRSLFEIKGNRTLVMKQFAENLLSILDPDSRKRLVEINKIKKASAKRGIKAGIKLRIAGKKKIQLPRLTFPKKHDLKIPLNMPSRDNIRIPRIKLSKTKKDNKKKQ